MKNSMELYTHIHVIKYMAVNILINLFLDFGKYMAVKYLKSCDHVREIMVVNILINLCLNFPCFQIWCSSNKEQLEVTYNISQ